VITAILKKVTWKDMLHLFMKEKIHSHVNSVITAVLKSKNWNDMFQKSMQETSLICEEYLEKNIKSVQK
jgi:hypothetical protein